MENRHESPWVISQKRVPYGHTDKMGHVYYGHALLYFEMGRTEWMREGGMTYRQFEEDGLFVPVVEAYVRYRGRIFYDDLIEISTSATSVGRTRYKFFYEMRRAGEEKVLYEGNTVHGIVDSNGRPKRVPPMFIEMLERLGENKSEKS
ncbi:acyl-CoA thioesterase YbgC [bacterium BMS3Bbin04]|nr:acyl-CoA thioesterase YbgC [bacterium BMS3Bbin04]